VVLGFESSDHDVIATRLEAELGDPRAARGVLDGGTVGQQLGGRTELLGVVVGDPDGVGDQRVGPSHRQRLDGAVVAPSGSPPLAAAPLETVDVHRCRNSA
jgi:hypothetical protein